MGGEHLLVANASRRPTGSSPHGWGTLSCLSYCLLSCRFIPTWVGNTSDSSISSYGASVHPHMGGEHAIDIAKGIYFDGSSPHGWGTLIRVDTQLGNIRFIPTWVGNTRLKITVRRLIAVHPHMGGEHLSVPCYDIGLSGSSPHGWGTHYFTVDITVISRFIPTWVGNTKPVHRGCRRWTVHPHMGGEHRTTRAYMVSTPGSSPHGWGTPLML